MVVAATVDDDELLSPLTMLGDDDDDEMELVEAGELPMMMIKTKSSCSPFRRLEKPRGAEVELRACHGDAGS